MYANAQKQGFPFSFSFSFSFCFCFRFVVLFLVFILPKRTFLNRKRREERKGCTYIRFGPFLQRLARERSRERRKEERKETRRARMEDELAALIGRISLGASEGDKEEQVKFVLPKEALEVDPEGLPDALQAVASCVKEFYGRTHDLEEFDAYSFSVVSRNFLNAFTDAVMGANKAGKALEVC